MKIDKLSDYMAYVEKLPSNFSLSRGQEKNFPLLPGGLRKDETGNRKYTKRSIRSFLEQFKVDAYQYMINPWDIKNDIEWMLHAQHYGIPTKLMDFTTSHISSLLFAVEKSFHNDSEDDAVVYFLNPKNLNIKIKEQAQIINISDSEGINSEGHDGPFVIQARKINPRINAQKGLFVLFQDDDRPLEEICDESILRKVLINGEECKKILSALYSMGISFTHIYPELSSVARDIVLKQDIEDFLRESDSND